MAIVAGRCLLRYRLKDIGMSQQELADKVRLPRQRISDYVNNRSKMGLETAKTIASALDCYIDNLYEWKQVKK